MENASQALFMAAGVLVAVMVISIGIFLVTSASSVSENFDQTMSQTEVLKFNAQFDKFATSELGDPEILEDADAKDIIKNTRYNIASDVVSAVNLAYSLNADYNYDVQRGIQVTIKGLEGGTCGITPLLQKKYHERAVSAKMIVADDNGKIYPLNKNEKSDYESISILPSNSPELKNMNELLQEKMNCKIYKGKYNVYKIYEYYFSGEVSLNSETGLVDKIEFTLVNNHDIYENKI